MDFKYIKTFLKIAELRSFSKAAEHLGYSQSAVSTQIARLESELNKTLLERIGHKIYLTESGKCFERYAQNIMALTENFHHDLNGNLNIDGTIRIATADSLCSSLFTHLFINYQKHYPNVQFHMRTGFTHEMLDWLSSNEIDLIYTLDHKVVHPELKVIQEHIENVSFYIHSSHPLSQKQKICLSDLKEYPIYLTEPGISYRKLLDEALAKFNFSLSPTLEAANVQVIRELILQTNGIGFIPEFVVLEDVKKGAILPISLEGLSISVYRQLIHHKGKSLTPAIHSFISFIS